MNRFIYTVILLSFLAMSVSSCFQQEGLMFDVPPVEPPDPVPTKDETILYTTNNAGPSGQGLIAKIYDRAGDTALVFGTFLPGGDVNIRSLAYARMDSDTVTHLFFEETGLLPNSIALNLKSGSKLNTLLTFEDYLTYSRTMSLLDASWEEGKADVEWRWRVDKSADIPEPVPVYMRDECQVLRPLTQSNWSASLREILEVVYDRLNGLTTIDPTIFRSQDILRLQQLLDQACTAEVVRETGAPAVAPYYPDDAFYELIIRPYGCADHNGLMTQFRTTLDTEGNLIFSEVQGGEPPFSFAVDAFDFRDSPQIPGSYDPNRLYLLMVRDGNGCISSRVAYVGRPVQDACSIVCGKTWTAYEATIVQESGPPVYDMDCNLLDGGCPHRTADRCEDGSLIEYSDFTFSLEEFQLVFGNTGKLTASYNFRYHDRQELSVDSCTLETVSEQSEQLSENYSWFTRTPDILLVYDQQDIFGRLLIEGPNDLLFERYDPVEKTTLSIKLRVE